MSQNITLLGASYTDVPSVELPKTGGGTASFTDVTDTTASASDVASGKYFYTAAGVRTEGTGSGGGGEQTWYSDVGDLYTENMTPSSSAYRFVREAFKNATHLKSFILDHSSASVDANYGLFRGCTALKTVWVSRASLDTYSFENCPSLEIITLGRVGLAVTSVNNGVFNKVNYTHIQSITVYVNASDLSGVPSAVKDRITPSYSHGAVITYKNYSSGDTIATVTVP